MLKFLRNSPKLVNIGAIVLVLLLISSVVVYAQDDDGDAEGESATQLPELPLTSDFTYVVQTGDTLDEIAAVFDVRLACVREVNDIGTDDATGIIRAGDELLIDTDCPAYDGQLTVEFPRDDAPGRTGEDGTYVVQPGDTLDVLGQTFNISVVQLRQVNDLSDTAVLQAGQVLIMPAEEDRTPYGQFPPLFDPSDEGVGGGGDFDLYVVQPLDTLDTIGQALDVSVVQLRQLNDIGRTEVIIPGQQLLIPTEENRTPYGQFPPLFDPSDEGVGGGGDFDLYVVQPLDTLDTIGQALDVSVVQLRQLNDIGRTEVIIPGQQLLIPTEENRTPYGQFPPLFDPSDEGVGGGGDFDLYVVQPLDTLDTIAQAFEMSAVQLRQINEIGRTEVLIPGQQLIIPAEEDRTPYGQFPPLFDPSDEGVGGGGDFDLYVVQPLDTLDTIGQALDVSVVQLRQLNDIGRFETIIPGQQLLIPIGDDRVAYGLFPPIIDPDEEADGGVGGGFDGDVYVLQPLETVDGVAQDFNVSTRCLLEFNGITNTRTVQPGTQIFIPTTCPPYGTFPATTTTDDSADDATDTTEGEG